MKQILLATALIALPVAAFSGYKLYLAPTTAGAQVSAGIGDTSAFTTIITDVQAFADKGDLASAKTRITDFEIAWDENAKGLRPMDPATWGSIDGAADTAMKAVRAGTPDAAAIKVALAALQASLVAQPAASTAAIPVAASGLGDTSAFTAIITDVQTSADKGDFAGAKTRIKDFETAWDEKANALRAMDPTTWDTVDGAADAALDAIRATSRDAAAIKTTLATLQTSLAPKS